CLLGSLILPNFITGNVNTNWRKLENTIKLAVRFLDNVIDINKYVLKQNDMKAHASRRIGIGVLGLANYFFSKQIRYGSQESILELEKLMKFIRDCIYQTSVELAVEKGAFPKFDPIQYVKSSFVRKLPVSLRMEIKKKGVRNVAGMAQAPTGTISLLCDYTSGIEPLIAKAYRREDRVGSRIYINPIYEEILKKEGKTPDWFVDSFDLKPEEHFEIQSIAQKYTDGSISKTINLPNDATVDDLDKLLLEYAKDLKGVTVYRDGSREGQILNPLTEQETLEYLKKNGVEINRNLAVEDVQCNGGTCEI
ncbi:MAG: ribonucleoside-diphosphate reductase, adenosylcobalamin-dependent, partial [Cryomorphaceae bacterium]|nr:ribonucleoside-diphosphate reductase, adenosylcobalamin-dependent [Cryomorphaceae bacterium]